MLDGPGEPASTDGLFRRAIDLVRVFHEAKDLPVATTPTLDYTHRQLRDWGNQVMEEANELRTAIADHNALGIVKETADVLYSALGIAVALGLRLDPAFIAVHEHKLKEPGGATTRQATADGIFGPASRLVREYHVAAQLPIATHFSVHAHGTAPISADRLVNEARSLKWALLDRSGPNIAKKLAGVLYSALSLAITFGVQIDAAFLDIHQENMTKDRSVHKRGVAQKPAKGKLYTGSDLSRLTGQAPTDEAQSS